MSDPVWHRWDQPFNTAYNAEDGRRTLRLLIQREEEELRARVPTMSMLQGVPDACLFQKHDTMRGHLASMVREVEVTRRVLGEELRRTGHGMNPATPQRCVVYRWVASA